MALAPGVRLASALFHAHSLYNMCYLAQHVRHLGHPGSRRVTITQRHYRTSQEECLLHASQNINMELSLKWNAMRRYTFLFFIVTDMQTTTTKDIKCTAATKQPQFEVWKNCTTADVVVCR